MSAEQVQKEPTMEEILSSIRKIISEEDSDPSQTTPIEVEIEMDEPQPGGVLTRSEIEALLRPAVQDAETKAETSKQIAALESEIDLLRSQLNQQTELYEQLLSSVDRVVTDLNDSFSRFWASRQANG